MMKDRVQRTYRKKPAHRLRNAMIAMVVFTAAVSASSAVVLSVYSRANNELSRRIDNYNAEVDYLEKENVDSFQKYNHKIP